MSLENELKKNTAALEKLTSIMEAGHAPSLENGTGVGSNGGNLPADNERTQPAANTVVQPVAEARLYTKQDLNAGLQSIAVAQGVPAAKALLVPFNVGGVAALPEDQYPQMAEAIIAAGGTL